MRFIELFAGIGGFRLGLEKANRSKRIWDKPISKQGRNHNSNRFTLLQRTRHKGKQDEGSRDRNILQSKTPKGVQKTMPSIKERKARFTCVYANEWNKYACQIYRKNFGKRMFDKNPEVYKATTKVRGKKGQFGKQFNGGTEGQYDCSELQEEDITRVSADSIPDHDLLTAGFPCPTYSIAGKRKGFEDPRGVVFFEICRIAEVKKPALLLLENVKGLLNHENGETFQIILNSLSKLGYDCEWEVFNSAYYSVPQHRERVYIIGHLRGKGGQKIFPLGSTMRKNNESSKRQTSGCVKGVSGHIQNDDTYIIYWKNSKEKWVKENRKSTTVLKTQSDLCRRPLIQINKNVSDARRVYDIRGLAKSLKGLGGGQGAKTGLYMNTLTEAIGTRQGSSKEFIESVKNINKAIGAIRRLTPTECERLQGFPDGWTEGISDTQRYKCLGNAVTVNVVEEIGKKIAQI